MTMKLRYDLLDDLEADDKQTSASDLISNGNPSSDYKFIIHFYDFDDKSSLEERVEMIMLSCLQEFSDIEFDNKTKQLSVGFNSSFLNIKSYVRFIKAIENLDTQFNIERDDDKVEWIIASEDHEGIPDDEFEYEHLHLAYDLFPFDKYGFKPFDVVITQTPEERMLKSIDADVDVLYPIKQFKGTSDLSFLEYADDYDVLIRNYVQLYVPHIDINILTKYQGTRYVLRNKITEVKNPYYLFAYDDDFKSYAFFMSIGRIYISDIGNAIDVYITTVVTQSDLDFEFVNTRQDFIYRVSKLFNNYPPEDLIETIYNQIEKPISGEDE